MNYTIKYKPAVYPFSSLFDRFEYEVLEKSQSIIGYPKEDIWKFDDYTELRISIPGWKKDQILVELKGEILTVKSKESSEYSEKETKGKGGTPICRNSKYSSFKYERSINMKAVDTEKITSKLEDGVLTITLPHKNVKEREIESQIIEIT